MEDKDGELYLAGDWLREAVLGRGSRAMVTLWKNRITGEILTIKQCIKKNTDLKQQSDHPKKTIEHPNIAKSILLPEQLANSFRRERILAMNCAEFCNGGNLRTRLNLPEHCIGLKEPEVKTILRQIGSALQHLHSLNVAHGDLKPESILLTKSLLNADITVYKLADAGGRDWNKDRAGLNHLPPETHHDAEQLPAVDYWSFGVLAAELINGIQPFPREFSPSALSKALLAKSEHEVCAEIASDGNLIFHERLFEESLCCEPFRSAISEWLKSALDINPFYRGKDTLGNRVIIFENLERVLENTIVTVLWSEGRKILHYGVDCFTRWNTIQEWIERDCSIKKDQQLLLTSSGRNLCDEFCNEFLHSPYKISEPIFVLSSENPQTIKHPRIGNPLTKYLDKPEIEPNRTEVPKIKRQLFTYIHILEDIEDSSPKSKSAYISFAKAEIAKSASLRTECNESFIVLQEKHSRMISATQTDQKCMEGRKIDNSFAGKYKTWLQSTVNTLEEARKFKEAQKSIDARLNSARRRIEEISYPVESSELLQKAHLFLLPVGKPTLGEIRQVIKLISEYLKKREQPSEEYQKLSIACTGLLRENDKIKNIINQLKIEAARLSLELQKIVEARDELLWNNANSSAPFKIGGSVRCENIPKIINQNIPDLSSLLMDSMNLRDSSKRIIEDFNLKREHILKEIKTDIC